MQRTQISLLMTLLGSLASTVQGDPVQWTVGEGGNGHWYEGIACQDFCTWQEARDSAIAMGGDLASVNTEGENDFIFSVIAKNEALWFNFQGVTVGPYLGGYQNINAPDYSEPNGGWYWADGSSFDSYTAWNEGEPGNSCGGLPENFVNYMGFGSPSMLWNDIGDECHGGLAGFVIEWDHDPNIKQWRIEDGGNGHWYQAIAEPNLFWEDAQELAISMGGYLATPTSPEENQFIYEMIEPMDSMWNGGQWNGPWIGGYQDYSSDDFEEPQGGWRWVTDEVWDFTNWATNQPDDGGAKHTENHLQYWQRDQNTWNDLQSTAYVSGYVVEYTSLPGNILGACCIDGECYEETEEYCIVEGGTWHGLDTVCCAIDCGPPPCPGDYDNNGTVNTIDILEVIAHWGQPRTIWDPNASGFVDVFDLLNVINNWGDCPGIIIDPLLGGAPTYGAVKWEIADGGNGHWYYLMELNPPQSAEQHFAIAESMGGHTVTFSSLAENEFCFNLTNNCTAPWSGPIIGVRKEEGNNQGAWITGEPWNFTNWHTGEGRNSWERYANLWVNENETPQWQDTDLTPHAFSIVEWSD